MENKGLLENQAGSTHKKTMCTELININYSTFKSLCTHCSFQTCLIEEDKLVFAGPPNRGYKDKKRKRPHIENCY